jgi:hypothetical protein
LRYRVGSKINLKLGVVLGVIEFCRSYKLISRRSTQNEGALLRISVALIYFFSRAKVARWFFCLVSFSTSFVLVSREFNVYTCMYAKGSPLLRCSRCGSEPTTDLHLDTLFSTHPLTPIL